MLNVHFTGRIKINLLIATIPILLLTMNYLRTYQTIKISSNTWKILFILMNLNQVKDKELNDGFIIAVYLLNWRLCHELTKKLI